MRKVIISLAPVSAIVPPVAESLAIDVEKSVQAGAAMCHLHSRTETGALSSDTTYMIECFEKILKRTDVIVQASTGGVSSMSIEERCYPLNYEKVETASLNGGSTNLGEAIYNNSFEDIRYCARMVYEKEILPEIEVFDTGMINNIYLVKEKLPFRSPILFNLVFGHQGGMQPTIEALTAFKSFVPKDAMWGVTHYGRDNWTFLAAAIAMGASLVRIGFEDSRFIEPGVDATYNYEVVERLVRLIRAMGLEVATPDDAREIMGIGIKDSKLIEPGLDGTYYEVVDKLVQLIKEMTPDEAKKLMGL